MKYHNIESWRKTIQNGAYGIKDRMVADTKRCITFYSNARAATTKGEEKRLERVDMLKIILSELEPNVGQLTLFAS